MNNEQKPPSLLEMIGGTVAVLEGVNALTTTLPGTVALAAVVWLLLWDRKRLDN